ncbi:MAG: adenylate/guanylate cyclase domain-containing protein [Proteobacteria bacterium]|nr:adenylate/guanylate cyclase domain-containing protein [Pseudomonadota bacterium]
MNERFNRLLSISPLKISLSIIFIAILLYFMNVPFLRFMELKTLDLRTISRGERAPGGEIVIAAIDEKSLAELGRWPWPRSTIAKLVDTLKGYGSKVVGFDIVFAEPAKTDAILAGSIRQAENVTLGYFFHTTEEDIAHLSGEDIEKAAENISGSKYQIVRFSRNPDESTLVRTCAVAANVEPLSDAAENSGYFNYFPDSDGTIRWSPLVIKFGDSFYQPLSISVLLQYMDWPMVTLKMADFGVEGIRIDGIDIPTNESGKMLINYLGSPKTFSHYSITDIINGRLEPGLFKDRIVLVGATAIGIYDLRVTPFSTVFPGIEVHATVIDNILHQSFLKRPDWVGLFDIAAIIFLGLVIGIALPRVRAVSGVIFSLMLLAAYILFNRFVFTHYNLWLNLVYPVVTMLAVYIGITVYKYITEEREKKKIRGAFQYYLTPSVINEILKDPSMLKLGGEKKDLTVLFSDIRGFTTVSERLSPEELVHLLNEYLTAMTDVVFKHEGLLDKYMGDAIMSVFGAPLTQEDHPARACSTAREMMEELKTLQKKWADEGRPVLDIGIGVNSGDMVVGNMGSEMRFVYTVMGDSVNLGSRLEGINKEYGTNVIISEYTYDRVKENFFCRELDLVRVKGKELPVKIYELLGEMKDSEKWEGFVKPFEDGLAKYRQGEWDEAVICFQDVLSIRPGDPPSEIYIERCREIKKNPPVGEWDGVYIMTKK